MRSSKGGGMSPSGAFDEKPSPNGRVRLCVSASPFNLGGK